MDLEANGKPVGPEVVMAQPYPGNAHAAAAQQQPPAYSYGAVGAAQHQQPYDAAQAPYDVYDAPPASAPAAKGSGGGGYLKVGRAGAP